MPDQERPNEGVFALQDDDDQWMALRYDLTGAAGPLRCGEFRRAAEALSPLGGGASVGETRRPGPGRFREFWQCDADTVGSASPAADAEMCMLAVTALEAAGLQQGSYKLLVSHRKLLDGALEAAEVLPDARLTVMRALDKLDRLGAAGVRALLGPGSS
ncbi:MAG: ATP phosphoribosyltransferase regulatory subunit [Terricaulis sp.]